MKNPCFSWAFKRLVQMVVLLCCVVSHGKSHGPPNTGGSTDTNIRLAHFVKVAERYLNTPQVKSDFEHKSHFKLLKKTLQLKGHIYTSRGLMLMEWQKPEQRRIVVDNNYAWLETRNKSAGVQVYKAALNTKGHVALGKKRPGSLSQLLAQHKSGLVKTTTKEGDYVLYDIDLSKLPFLKNQKLLQIKLHKNTVHSVHLEDHLENTQTYTFTNTEFKTRARSIRYKKPRGARVISL